MQPCLLFYAVALLYFSKLSVAEPYDPEAASTAEFDDDSTEDDEAESEEEAPDDPGFVTPFDFTPLFPTDNIGVAQPQPAVNPLVGAIQQAPVLNNLNNLNNLVPFNSPSNGVVQFFQPQVAASEQQFSPESFGFKPARSQWLGSPVTQQNQAYIQAPYQNLQPYQQYPNSNNYQLRQVKVEKTKAIGQTAALSQAPLQYEIHTKHDPNYKTYKDEENAADEKPRENVAPIKRYNNQAPLANYRINHPNEPPKPKSDEHLLPYKKYSFQPSSQPGPLLRGGPPRPAGPLHPRHKRYSNSRKKPKKKKAKKAEEDYPPYDYDSDYHSRPKQFSGSRYTASDEDDEDDSKKDDYSSDDDFSADDEEYERIKSISEKQSAELKKNPENCKEVKRDSMTCTVCANPKNGGNYESCAYVSEPKNNKYAYVKERKYDSDDEPEGADETAKSETIEPSEEKSPPSSHEHYKKPKKSRGGSKKPHFSPETTPSYELSESLKQYPYESQYDDTKSNPYPEYHPKNTHKPKYNEEIKQDDSDSEEKDYDNDDVIPGFYTDTEPKKDVEHVLAEFAKKDRSACKKVYKNKMTCYQCVDKNGLKHEECMFVSESAPKSSHLAYQELKEFTSRPPTTLAPVIDSAESQIVTTARPALRSRVAPTAAFSTTPTIKIKRKKFGREQRYEPAKYTAHQEQESIPKRQRWNPYNPQSNKAKISYEPDTNKARIAKRDDGDQNNEKDSPKLLDNIAPPSDFASEDSKGAFWEETVPRFSRSLGVSLPAFMINKSEHEATFDETLSTG